MYRLEAVIAEQHEAARQRDHMTQRIDHVLKLVSGAVMPQLELLMQQQKHHQKRPQAQTDQEKKLPNNERSIESGSGASKWVCASSSSVEDTSKFAKVYSTSPAG